MCLASVTWLIGFRFRVVWQAPIFCSTIVGDATPFRSTCKLVVAEVSTPCFLFALIVEFSKSPVPIINQRPDIVLCKHTIFPKFLISVDIILFIILGKKVKRNTSVRCIQVRIGWSQRPTCIISKSTIKVIRCYHPFFSIIGKPLPVFLNTITI